MIRKGLQNGIPIFADIEDRNSAVENTDLILRDTITVSVNTRNIGLQ